MPSPLGARLKVEVLRLSPGDVARGSRELVEAERAAVSAWPLLPQEDQEQIRTIVRAALVRLLETDHWLPGSVTVDGSRLDVRLTIEIDDNALAAARADLNYQFRRARGRLVELLARFGDDDGESS